MKKSKKIGILRFWGTNCDYDVQKWVELSGYSSEFLWFENQFNTADYEALIIPGGFSYGDYLRCGAMAARTQVMRSVFSFAKEGRPILGICNGFQILCEAGLLPGALVKNEKQNFIDDFVRLEIVNKVEYFSSDNLSRKNDLAELVLPIAHGEGRFYATGDILKTIQDNDQVWMRYKNNPNGSINDIAGLRSKEGRICALMPHPERALYSWMGSSDGLDFLPKA